MQVKDPRTVTDNDTEIVNVLNMIGILISFLSLVVNFSGDGIALKSCDSLCR